MTQHCTNLPGIVEVRWVETDMLSPNIEAKYLAGLPVAVLAESYALDVHGTAECQAVEEHESNGRVEKTTLTFQTLSDVPQKRNVAWCVKQASGQWWLIGTKEQHWPTVKVTTNTGKPEGEAAIKTVEVTHVALKSLIPVAV